MFGARQHDDGTWRLCERRGRTIITAYGKSVVFKGRADCERCAKELNEHWWEEFVRARKAKAIEPEPYAGIIATLRKHGGLSAEDHQELLK